MKIFNVNNTNNYSVVNFKRKPTAKEFEYYTPAIKEGLKLLNKDLGLIIHNSSVPSRAGENLGIGSLLSKATQAFFVPFLKSHGINSIQQEPNYLRRVFEPSPYDPISTAKNIYMIPLEKLATDEYGNILSEKFIDEIKSINESEEKYDKVNYPRVDAHYRLALAEAYDKFINAKDNILLKQEFESFKISKREELEPYAIYEIFTGYYGNEDWKTWKDVHQNVYSSENLEYLNAIRKEDEDLIDFYLFKQWLVEREIQKTNKENEKAGLKIIADTPIAFTPAEVWANKDLFLKDLVLGCPPDYFSREGQRWDFAVLNPKTIFNKDGSLGKGGEFLRKRYEAIFEASPGGVRIDHLIGLIDPFVYLESEPHMNETNSGRLYSSPHKMLLRDYCKYTDSEYTAIFEKIIFPTAEKFGIAKDKIICEDLGDQTPPVRRAIEKLGLTGLSVTQFGYSGIDAPERNVIMLGSHDNQSYIEYTNDLFAKASNVGEGRDRFMYKTHILASDTSTPKQNVDNYREELRKDPIKFLTASFAELFISPAKKVQIFFTDFFGIGKTYNVPGQKDGCWTLRLQENYEDLYYENLKKGLAVNLPEAIAIAIRRKGEDFSTKHTDLLRKLDFFASVLKR